MRSKLVQSIAGLLIGAGMATAQGPATGTDAAPEKLASSVTSPARMPAGTFSSQSPLASAPVESSVDSGVTSAWGHGTPCRQPYTFYASGEFMLMNLRNFHIPTLASNIAVGLIRINDPALPNSPFVLPVSVANNPQLGVNPIDFADQTGGRGTVGVWLDEEQDFGLEASFFWLGRATHNFQATTSNTVNQFNIQTGLFISANGAVASSGTDPLVIPRQTSANLVGSAYSELCAGDLDCRSVIGQYGPVTFTGLSGFRHIRFNEGLTINNSVTLSRVPGFPDDSATGFPPVITFSTLDTVRTKNEIYAAQAGLELDAECWGMFLNMKGRVGLGANHEQVDILGLTSSTGGANPLTRAPGGLLSGPADQGTHRRYRISIIPEVNVKLGYAFNDNFRAYVGYDGMYLHHVARPDVQTTTTTINTQVTVNNSTNTINLSQPTFRFRDLDVWAAGVNFGVEFRY